MPQKFGVLVGKAISLLMKAGTKCLALRLRMFEI